MIRLTFLKDLFQNGPNIAVVLVDLYSLLEL
jgi:hypothetical protein